MLFRIKIIAKTTAAGGHFAKSALCISVDRKSFWDVAIFRMINPISVVLFLLGHA